MDPNKYIKFQICTGECKAPKEFIKFSQVRLVLHICRFYIHRSTTDQKYLKKKILESSKKAKLDFVTIVKTISIVFIVY